jgi:hypothetical protein
MREFTFPDHKDEERKVTKQMRGENEIRGSISRPKKDKLDNLVLILVTSKILSGNRLLGSARELKFIEEKSLFSHIMIFRTLTSSHVFLSFSYTSTGHQIGAEISLSKEEQ